MALQSTKKEAIISDLTITGNFPRSEINRTVQGEMWLNSILSFFDVLSLNCALCNGISAGPLHLPLAGKLTIEEKLIGFKLPGERFTLMADGSATGLLTRYPPRR